MNVILLLCIWQDMTRTKFLIPMRNIVRFQRLWLLLWLFILAHSQDCVEICSSYYYNYTRCCKLFRTILRFCECNFLSQLFLFRFLFTRKEVKNIKCLCQFYFLRAKVFWKMKKKYIYFCFHYAVAMKKFVGTLKL